MKIYSSKTKSWKSSVVASDSRVEANAIMSRKGDMGSQGKRRGKPALDIKGAEDFEDEIGGGTVDVDADVEGLVFDPEDVAELLAEVTGEDIEAEVADSGDAVTFRIGEDEYEVQADEDTQILEARSLSKGSKPIKASTREPRGRVVRTIKK